MSCDQAARTPDGLHSTTRTPSPKRLKGERNVARRRVARNFSTPSPTRFRPEDAGSARGQRGAQQPQEQVIPVLVGAGVEHDIHRFLLQKVIALGKFADIPAELPLGACLRWRITLSNLEAIVVHRLGCTMFFASKRAFCDYVGIPMRS